MTAKRILFDLVLFLGIFLAPFWLQVLLALFCLFYFRNYIEFVFVFLILDLVYSAPEGRYFGIRLFTFFVSIVVFAGAQFLKTKVSYYKDQR